MPRKARIDAAGALHHIIVREIERDLAFPLGLNYEHIQKSLRSLDLLTSGKIKVMKRKGTRETKRVGITV